MSDDRTEHEREQDRAIIGALRAAQWELDNVAHDLGANRVTDTAWKELLESLEHLANLVQMRSGARSKPLTLYPKETE